MRRPFRHNPGVTRFEQHHLPFQMQLGAAADHKTDGLIIAYGRGFGLARLRFLPETHRDVNARSEILLPHLPFWRILRLDLLDACVSHFASSENQPRRNEENEEKTEKTFVLFVSSWLIFIVSGCRSMRHERLLGKTWERRRPECEALQRSLLIEAPHAGRLRP